MKTFVTQTNRHTHTQWDPIVSSYNQREREENNKQKTAVGYYSIFQSKQNKKTKTKSKEFLENRHTNKQKTKNDPDKQ